MILKAALNLLKTQLLQFLQERDKLNWRSSYDVALANMAQLDVESNNAVTNTDKILIGIVNLEEESTLKNTIDVRRKNMHGDVEYLHPPVNLNLHLLFGSNFISYENAILWLSYIIEFFQTKKVFNLSNSGDSNDKDLLGPDFKMIMELETLSFEQMNFLWGSLGGKQIPHVLYKARLVKIQGDQILSRGRVITDISSSESIN